MASEYWFCRYYDEARLRKGLPGFGIETGIHYYCPKQFSSLIAFKTHAGKVHCGRSGTNSGLKFKHVIAQPPKEKARSALPVLREVDRSDSEHSNDASDLDPNFEAERDRRIRERVAHMIHDAQMESPTDTSDESSSEEERAAYEDGRPSISQPQRSEVCNIFTKTMSPVLEFDIYLT